MLKNTMTVVLATYPFRRGSVISRHVRKMAMTSPHRNGIKNAVQNSRTICILRVRIAAILGQPGKINRLIICEPDINGC